jgi:lysozyme
MLKPGVIDLSHWNEIIGDSYSASLSSLQRSKENGIHGLIHKATENGSYIDNMLKYRCDLSRDAGMLFGTYHFLRSGDMGQQVAHYFDSVQSVQKDEGESRKWVWVCDYEDPGIPLSDVADFMDQLDAVTGTDQHPVLYTGFALKDKIAAGQDASRLHKYALWLAHYATEPTLPKGWDRYWLWQYSDKASVPGIQAPTDVNAFDGTVEELVSGWVAPTAAGVTPTPQPKPEEPEGGVTPEEGEHPPKSKTKTLPGPGPYTTTITISSSEPMTAQVA